MKFVSFKHNDVISYGIVTTRGVVDLGIRYGDKFSDLKSYIAGKFPNLEPEGKLNVTYLIDEVELLPPIPVSDKIICVAINFYEDMLSKKPIPQYPLLFTRFSNSQIGHGNFITKPSVSNKLDFEGELAVIIGRAGYKISKDSAMSHVAGYSCYNDVTVRDWQKHSSQFTAGKNFFHTAGFGPWMVSTSEIRNPNQLQLTTRVNGVVKQSINMKKMIFDIPYLINYISTFTPLEVGDVIVTGTPSGFGSTRNPPEFLSENDTIEVEISEIGILSNNVKAESILL